MKKLFSQKIKTNVLGGRLFWTISLLWCVIVAVNANNHHAQLKANVTPTGAGLVYVSTEKSEFASISGWSSSDDEKVETEKEASITTTFYAYSKPNAGYFFTKWTGNISGISNPISWIAQIDSNGASEEKTTTANFRSIIETEKYGDKITLFYDPVTGEVAEGEWQVVVNYSESMTVDSLDDAFTRLTPEISLNGETDVATFVKISAENGTTGTHTGVIKLTPKNSDKESKYLYTPGAKLIDVVMSPSPMVTFEPAVVGGTYTFQQVSVTPTPQPVTVNETKQIGVLKATDGVIQLVATPATGYRVYRWVITGADGVAKYDYLSGNTKFDTETNFTTETSVTVEFTEDKYASFFVKENPSVKYNDLNLALEAAATSPSKTVVVDPTPNSQRIKGGYLRAGTYNIPDGYTLLVPGDANYTAIKDKTNPGDDIWLTDGAVSPSNFCKLIIEDGTTINVEGVLCVYAKWNYGNSTANYMKPGTYGWIEMEDNSVININDATLHALGYITNTNGTKITDNNINQVGRVIANNGAVVYEIFVMTDWRGGSAIAGSTSTSEQLYNLYKIADGDAVGFIKNKAKVFPINQYYIQNVEVPLTFNYGSKGKIQTMVNVSKFYPYATADFVISNTSTDPTDESIASGLFRLGNNTKATKYYDAIEDRLKFVIEEIEPNAEQTIPTFFHSLTMELDASLAKIPIVSSDYILPINNNMDVLIKSGSGLVVPENIDLCFLAGASLAIEQDARVEIKSNVYVYDADEKLFHDITSNTGVNGLGYFGSENAIIIPIPYRPGTLFSRTEGAIQDSKWHIDGKLILDGNLYTSVGGANITSAGGGEVMFNSKVLKDTTSQAYQSGIAYYYQIPITIAKLRNANGTFSAGNAIEVGQRYIYYSDVDGGTWMLPQAAVSNVTLPTLSVTMPTQSTPQGEIVCTVTKPEGVRDYVTNDFVIENSNTTLFTLLETGIPTVDEKDATLAEKSGSYFSVATTFTSLVRLTTAVLEFLIVNVAIRFSVLCLSCLLNVIGIIKLSPSTRCSPTVNNVVFEFSITKSLVT